MVVLGPRSLEREQKSGVSMSIEDPLTPLRAGSACGWEGALGRPVTWGPRAPAEHGWSVGPREGKGPPTYLSRNHSLG